MKPKMSAADLAILGLMGSILYLSQILLSPLPNVEIVSLLVIAYTVKWRWRALYPIYLFVLLQGITYGFGIWWWSYLYIWLLLALAVMLLKCRITPLLCAILCGFFGLLFGALCAMPYLIIGGPSMAFAWWISGLPFDILHCLGNIAASLILWTPVSRILKVQKVQYDRLESK